MKRGASLDQADSQRRNPTHQTIMWGKPSKSYESHGIEASLAKNQAIIQGTFGILLEGLGPNIRRSHFIR
jgi:hypothetical protein